MKSNKKSLLIPPLLAIFIAVLAVSTASIFIRFAQRDANSIVIAAYRLCLATIVLAPFAMKNHREELKGLKKSQFMLLTLSGVLLSMHFASWITSLEYTTVASSVVLVTTTPLWVAVLSPLVLREHIPPVLILGLIVAMLGGVIVGISKSCLINNGQLICPYLGEFLSGRASIGNLLALAGAWFASGYFLIGRWMRRSLSSISYTFLVYGVAAVVLLSIVALKGYEIMGYSQLTYIWFLALALVPQLLGHSTFNWALGYLSAAYVTVALLGEPVGSTLLAYLLLGEVPALLEVVGGGFTLTGIYIASRYSQKDV